MFRRLAVIAAIALLPTLVLADSASDYLGPQTSSTSGASTSLNGVLQPGTTQNLQNGSTSSADAYQGASSQTLQGSTPSDQTLQVIKGESDGSPKAPASGSSSNWAFILGLMSLAAVALGGAFYLYKGADLVKKLKNRSSSPAPDEVSPPVSAEATDDIAAEDAAVYGETIETVADDKVSESSESGATSEEKDENLQPESTPPKA